MSRPSEMFVIEVYRCTELVMHGLIFVSTLNVRVLVQ
jgi:hypothetical protein